MEKLTNDNNLLSSANMVYLLYEATVTYSSEDFSEDYSYIFG